MFRTLVSKRLFTTSPMVSTQVKNKVEQLIKTKPVFIASKSYCPYCKATKNTIEGITKDAYIIELDELDDGAEIQEALLELTGQRTVPNVFIGGQHIGGNSDVQALKSSDKLDDKIKAAL
ncbi:Glutaredoxin-2, mitochondrial [Candida viswanathii]|uniref:Glutaredoxin-2, mitochondrial n=1 Tax=Candida viswanathii TaxID=5486 RepID=A0A367Y3H4_9ASCO|nr:Glutaredoxin-2, mitochondrial [Candida viswanathii]RCK60387.1 Glutaredoxin-2, mitochondrial [Candida viswanathii]